jgi:hypothetical protein
MGREFVILDFINMLDMLCAIDHKEIIPCRLD